MVVETRGSVSAANSDPKPLLHLITDTYLMERGPRYDAYSKLRESKIRMRFAAIPEEEEDDLPIRGDKSPVIGVPRPETTPSPIKKSVRFQGGGQVLQSLKRKGQGPSSGMVAQSVPDLSTVLRKENRRPPPANRVEKSVTPPARKPSKVFGSGSKLGMGSKSVNSGEKRGVGVGDGGFGFVGRTTTAAATGMAARRSYAIDELKGLSAVAAAAITGESRGVGGGRRVVGRTSVMGLRQYY